MLPVLYLSQQKTKKMKKTDGMQRPDDMQPGQGFGGRGTFENQEAVLSGTAPYNECRSEVLAEAILPGTLTAGDAGRISRLLDLSKKDTVLRLLEKGSFEPGRFMEETNELIRFFEKIYS